MIYMFLSNNPKLGDINLSNLSYWYKNGRFQAENAHVNKHIILDQGLYCCPNLTLHVAYLIRWSN